MTRFTTRNDLRTWVREHVGPDLTDAEVEQITECLRTDADFPRWGTDATAYLDSLPELVDLLTEQREQEQRRV